MNTQSNAQTDQSVQDIKEQLTTALGQRSIVLVGLMGAGKTTVGRRLAARLDLPFNDADAEIERAAGKTIPEIFEDHGEAAFRDGEKRVIARIMEEGPLVLATGGGAYMDADTRAAITEHGVSVWLKANTALLLKRVSKRGGRPLLKQGNPKQILKELVAKRYPVYGLANITVESKDVPHQQIVQLIVDALSHHLNLDDQSS
ncbi:MAG: shikimate kinase [Hyphomicrobiales bacterium]